MEVSLATFLLASLAIIGVPGPNVLIIVATSLQRGATGGLQTVAGTSAAMLVQLIVAGLGTGLLVTSLAKGLVWVKWVGVAYLFYLGVSSLLTRTTAPQDCPTGAQIFSRGFWISLTNPKTIFFFAAFLPQFVTSQEAYLPQVLLLSILFWVLAVVLDSSYALLASRLGRRFRYLSSKNVTRRLSGIVYLGAGSLLASVRQA